VGDALLVDSNWEEQLCASCVLSVAVDREGNCCGVTYLKNGMLKSAELMSAIEVSLLF
jgi:exosome complex RNA-binding protein Rrp42 (RNase PH superfamily)